MTSAHGNNNQPNSSVPQPILAKSIPWAPTVGSPAITPHLNASNVSLPAFTAEDAATYAMHHGLFLALRHGSSSVVSVRFMTDAAITAEFKGADPGLEPNGLVCVVELQGSFTLATTGKTYTIVYLVYNARSGNFLMLRSGGKITGGPSLGPASNQ